MKAKPSVLVQILLVTSVVIDEGMNYQFCVDLPDSAKPEVDACIERSRKTPVIPSQAELACVHDYFTKLEPNNLTEEDLEVFSKPSQNGFGHYPPPTGKSTRSEIRTLSEEGWHNVTDVFRQLYEAGTLQSFGRLHGQARSMAHKGAAFLPWHRVFLVHFEQEMRRINPSVSLPYWDYTIDHDIPQPFESVLWTPCYFGENNATVQTGPFRFFYGAHGAVISRDVAVNVRSTRLISKTDIKTLKEFCHFQDITTSGAVKTKSKHNLEQLHDSVHDYVGGDMGVVENSAYDPVFWFHHAFIDYIWETFREHQIERCSNIDIESDYRPLTDLGMKEVRQQGPLDPMFGYKHLRNVDGLWLNWTQQFYKYEPQPSCGKSCTGKYLHCDRRNLCLTRTKEECTGTKQQSARVLREDPDVDSLIPKLPCGTGTELRGLRGDGRTRDKSKAECERILKKREVEDTSDNKGTSSNDGWNNFGFVMLGAFVVLVVALIDCIGCLKRNDKPYSTL
ncbi:putative tyrosinase-like protein tyr-3 isoform X2 [Mercenaria mercenaria]|nr:putative tyrosinase-like protein tyr-3 isoform X2 [Mercenaria mercenaria]XP_045172670.2 putative tyrosinase-like protein tyr-3 isoform X2 [Mercenaria mercenaria]